MAYQYHEQDISLKTQASEVISGAAISEDSRAFYACRSGVARAPLADDGVICYMFSTNPDMKGLASHMSA